ncbi:hypothetical protein [Persephonella sp. KM09-Lau-8]|uniref:hypothetical protein n=1 Tax=Persephonella sp. KM09-Lau-8 TaxID=1158345 RepID=UPI000494DF83|nr:hypothetical protein [Persephonella sp. KM09-Lau-8]
MATVREIKYIREILKKIDSIREIEKAEIIEIPEDVEADIGLKIKPKNSKDRYKILEKLNDLEWEIYDKYGVLPTIYWEFNYKNK